ncbi:MAG: hypothetical protein QOF57_2491 [Frankiaceae bacterium]|jgi:iron-sulfur cluster repair protein YtfE (RIC family)|nr:hypothetical protein [Frankiaceae bacterium]MDQ1727709.1 hypothetical protein [Frankiaceae bacterium]
MFEQLRWVHDKLRRDLKTVRQLAAQVDAGAPVAKVQATLSRLQTKGPLWQLKVDCLSYCEFVHVHHGIEDAHLFPSVLRADPSLRPAVKRLVADHAKVSDLLDEIEAAVRNLSDGDAAARSRVSSGLAALSEHLLEHLSFEERSLEKVLGTMRA